MLVKQERDKLQVWLSLRRTGVLVTPSDIERHKAGDSKRITKTRKTKARKKDKPQGTNFRLCFAFSWFRLSCIRDSFHPVMQPVFFFAGLHTTNPEIQLSPAGLLLANHVMPKRQV
jgi:hypothetical protein